MLNEKNIKIIWTEPARNEQKVFENFSKYESYFSFFLFL